jgi:subtilisin family serine protease
MFGGFPRTTELMQGIDYVIRKAQEMRMPVAVNISFGNTYGARDGTSLLERFIDDISNIWKSCICIGTGNEGATPGHTSGRLREKTVEEQNIGNRNLLENVRANTEQEIELAVQEKQPSLNVQIWKRYVDQIDISIVSPTGTRIGPVKEQLGTQRFTVDATEILLYYGEPSPFSTNQEIYLDFLPRGSYINSGVWKMVLTPRKIVDGHYEMWIPGEGTLNPGTGFLRPVSSTTLTNPATAMRAITVGAYDSLTFSYADFSGRGPLTGESASAVKPDLVAPGVNVNTVSVGGGVAEFSGTSFATPFVTGSAALLMEWGIVRENDIYLYGEKVKAYLRRGAKPMPGFEEYPNEAVGYGRLCLAESIPD